MKYPKFKVVSSPSPAEHLVICDKCDKAEWVIFEQKRIYYCANKHRMRPASSKEIEEANKILNACVL